MISAEEAYAKTVMLAHISVENKIGQAMTRSKTQTDICIQEFDARVWSEVLATLQQGGYQIKDSPQGRTWVIVQW